jgi:hypothetical protein
MHNYGMLNIALRRLLPGRYLCNDQLPRFRRSDGRCVVNLRCFGDGKRQNDLGNHARCLALQGDRGGHRPYDRSRCPCFYAIVVSATNQSALLPITRWRDIRVDQLLGRELTCVRAARDPLEISATSRVRHKPKNQ